MIVTRLCARRYTAGKGDDLFIIFLCKSGYTNGCFPHYSLTVKSAFTCDHQVTDFDFIFKTCFIHNDTDAGLQGSIGICQKGIAKTAGCTGAGIILIGIGNLFLRKGGKGL